MTAPPAQSPRSATYGAGALLAAAAGLLGIIVLLAVLSVVVRDANARAAERKVVAGKISVVGAAKLREWESERFSVKIPAGWGVIASGPVDVVGGGSSSRQREHDNHTWQGSLADPREPGECDPGLVCFAIDVEERNVSGAKTPRAFAQLARDEAAGTPASDSREEIIDIGPVQGPRNRWMWRLVTAKGGEQRLRYMFATCSGGEVERFWMLSLFAPPEYDARTDLADILGSLDVEGKSPQRPRSVKRTNKRDSQDSDCSTVIDAVS